MLYLTLQDDPFAGQQHGEADLLEVGVFHGYIYYLLQYTEWVVYCWIILYDRANLTLDHACIIILLYCRTSTAVVCVPSHAVRGRKG